MDCREFAVHREISLDLFGKYPDTGDMNASLDISAQDVRRALLERAKRYCVDHGTSFSAIGIAAVNDSKFLARVEKGFGFNIATYQKVMDWLDAESAPSAPTGEEAA